jgi:hypothetical protein
MDSSICVLIASRFAIFCLAIANAAANNAASGNLNNLLRILTLTLEGTPRDVRSVRDLRFVRMQCCIHNLPKTPENLEFSKEFPPDRQTFIDAYN